MRLQTVIALLLLANIKAFSQSNSIGEWTRSKWQHQTLPFENTGYMFKDIDSTNTGNSSFTYYHNNNKLRDAYMPEKSKGFTVASERISVTNKWSIYGNFKFSKYDDLQARYTSVANPNTDNPYQIVDALSGDWKKQHYLMEAKVLSPQITRNIRAGLSLKYEVLNGARQKDPRPLDKNINIELIPSIIVQPTERFSFGVNGYYNRKRQDLSISLENNLKTQEIYKLSGLGEYLYNGPIILSSGLSRTYGGNTFGGGTTVSFDLSSTSKFSLEATYKSHSEKAVDGSTIPFQAGEHSYNQFDVNGLYIQKTPISEHRIQLRSGMRKTADTEFVQVLNTKTQQYEIIHSAEMHNLKRTYAKLQYSVLWNKENQPTWGGDLYAVVHQTERNYSTTYGYQSNNLLTIGGGVSRIIALSNSQLSLTYGVAYQNSQSDKLQYVDKNYAKNFASEYILRPDHAFNTLGHLHNQVDIQYTFPAVNSHLSVYVKGSYKNHQNLSKNAYYLTSAQNNHFSITIGILN